jgi:hypothetical protein
MSIFDRFKRKTGPPHSVPLEAQLSELARAGIRLRAEFGIETLLESFPREEYEGNPYHLLMFRLGGTLEREPWTPLSDDIWHFDTECIDGPGSYVWIADRVSAITMGSLPLRAVRAEVDEGTSIARLSFTFDSERHHWELAVREDWVDGTIFDRFEQLLAKRGNKRFFFYEDGQAVLVLCRSAEEIDKIRQVTRMKFR